MCLPRKKVEYFYNAKKILLSHMVVVDPQNGLCEDFLVGLGMATGENRLSKNIAGCFHLTANRKQFLWRHSSENLV